MNNWTMVSATTKYELGMWKQAGAQCISRGPIQRYRRYHRPIDSAEHLGCNFVIETIQEFGERTVETCRKQLGSLTTNMDG